MFSILFSFQNALGGGHHALECAVAPHVFYPLARKGLGLHGASQHHAVALGHICVSQVSRDLALIPSSVYMLSWELQFQGLSVCPLLRDCVFSVHLTRERRESNY